MKTLLFILAVSILASCAQHTYYIVRHAEKGTTPANNPPLTDAGTQRAEHLKDLLKDKKIAYIFSTNFTRTLSTAQPLATATGITVEKYGPKPDTAFINKLKGLKKSTLIVGHSNTIDDIVNQLCNAIKVPADIDESVFDNLFVVTYRGKKIIFEARKY